MSKIYDTLIIGGGFYGLRIAQFLAEELGQKKILVIEKEKDVMQRASFNNQARVHNGYHYPRSVLTALRSRVNLPKFTNEFENAIERDFINYYAVAKNFSKVSARQYERFFRTIGADIDVSKKGMEFFSEKMIEEVFVVKEFAFDANKVKKQILDKLSMLGVDIITDEEIQKISTQKNNILVESNGVIRQSKFVINTTYSSINTINVNSGLSPIPLKHELTEMCLVDLPHELQNSAFTIMCGPFFSIMPFPALNSYTMSHVRYTPHSEWADNDIGIRDGHDYLKSIQKISHYPQMQADINRYLKSGHKIKYSGKSLWEVKTVLPTSETDDSRPIMYRPNYDGIKNYICIMGGKIDNIYDVFRELSDTYAKA